MQPGSSTMRLESTDSAVMDVFVDAYNQFGLAKYKNCLTHPHPNAQSLFALVDFS